MLTRRNSWRALAGAVVLLVGAGASAQNFIGAKRCQSCHPFEFQVWSHGPHARAHQSLTSEQLEDSKCNSCHTMSPTERHNAKLVGVQCESCHGPGRYYHPPFVMKDKELARAVGLIDPTAAQCQRCHTEGAPSIRPFDFAEMWSRIDHGRAARQAWEKKQAPAKAPPKTSEVPAAPTKRKAPASTGG